MRGWGIWMVILGVGSFVLPFFGLQFMLLDLLGTARPIVAIVMIIAGGLLIYFDSDE
jgi:hypothetical protein